MCGIAGVIGPRLGSQDAEFFKKLMFLSQWRGEDSTGFAAIRFPTAGIRKETKEGAHLPYRMIKAAEPASWFMDHKEVSKVLRENVDRVAYIGHTRAATVGAVTDENAHPYEFKNILGVYNGTTFRSDIPHESLTFDTDGEAIYNVLDKDGVSKGIGQILGLPNAPFAVAMFDKTDNKLKFARGEGTNSNRPLWFVWNKEHTRRYFASDPMFIYTVARVMNVDLDPNGPIQPKAGMIFSIPLLEDDFLNKVTGETPEVIKKEARPFASSQNPAWAARMAHRDRVNAALGSATTTTLPVLDGDEGDQTILPHGGGYPTSFATGTEGLESAFIPSVNWKDYTKEALAAKEDGTFKSESQKEKEARDARETRRSQTAEAWEQRERERFQRTVQNWGIGGALAPEDLPEETKLNLGVDSPTEKEAREYVGNHGTIITGDSLQKYLNDGCCQCGRVYDIRSEPHADLAIAWCSTDTGTRFVCEDCKNDEFIVENWVTYDHEKELLKKHKRAF